METNQISNFTTEAKNTQSIFIAIFLTILVCLVLCLLFFLHEIKECRNNEVQIKSLQSDLVDRTSELSNLATQLHKAKESLVILEREMTTFNDFDNTENLINRNSLFKTVQQIDLRIEPTVDSEVLHNIESGVTGEVIDGLRLVEGDVWWKVSFRSGEEGWVSEALLERVSSVVIKIDLDKDGKSDIKIRWEGEYDLDGIVAEPGTDGTYIRYKGKAMPEPYEVVEL